LGNEFTVGTYRYAGKALFRLPVPAMGVYPSPSGKDFEGCRNHFMWLGSDGLVNKGLDLVLEAFSRTPEHLLTVCGPVEKEEDFEKVYYEELYHTRNIHTIGWVDLEGEKFKEISERCVGLVYPSCSEGQSGAVVNCIRAGLIPIISYESGVDVEGFGVTLRDCTVDGIVAAVQNINRLPEEKLRGMAVKAWDYARMNHTKEKYARELKRFLDMVISAPAEEEFVIKADP
jgi:glycosyltransferase involved in cell wall biosynthesis